MEHKRLGPTHNTRRTGGPTEARTTMIVPTYKTQWRTMYKLCTSASRTSNAPERTEMMIPAFAQPVGDLRYPPSLPFSRPRAVRSRNSPTPYSANISLRRRGSPRERVTRESTAPSCMARVEESSQAWAHERGASFAHLHFVCSSCQSTC